MGVSSIYRELIKTARRIDRKLETMGFSYLRKDIDETSGYFLGSYVPIEYVFFDGKEVRKIDNFPDSEFLNRNYDAYIENLKCLFAYRNIEFIQFAFFGIRPTHYDWFKKYRCRKSLRECVELQKVDENVVKIKDGVAHIIGNPTEIETGIYSLLMINRVEVELIHDNISPHGKFNINGNYKVPLSLQKYIYFDGKKFCKKDNFPKRLNKKYNKYIKKLKCLYGVFIRFQLAQMIGEYKVFVYGPGQYIKSKIKKWWLLNDKIII